MVVGRVLRRVQVVGDAPEAIEATADQLLTISQQAEGLAYPFVLERRLGGVEVKATERSGRRHHQLQPRVGLDQGAVLGLHAAGNVDLPGAQRRNPRHLVLEFDDLQLVGIRLVGFEIVLEPGEQRALARHEAFQPVRPRPHRVAHRVVIGRHDAAEGDQGFIQREEAAALLEADLDGALVELAQGLAVDGADQPGKRRGQFWVGQAQDREQHVIGGDALAVVELQARLDADGPGAGIGVGLGEFGQAQARADVVVPLPELAVQRPAANDPAARRLVRIEVAGLVAVDDADAQAPATHRLGRPGDGCACGRFSTAATCEQAGAEQQAATDGQAVAEEHPAGKFVWHGQLLKPVRQPCAHSGAECRNRGPGRARGTAGRRPGGLHRSAGNPRG
ncbi:hypothetical protein D9M71_377560 [compost metagenome]